MIEISDATAKWLFRVNPFNLRCVDWKENKPRARWEPYKTYATQEEAAAALMELYRKEAKDVSK